MAGLRVNSSVPSLPLPRPKSPPECLDLHGKRGELAKAQLLEREIGFLEDELKSVEGLPPASRSCKEVADFVTCSADPFIPLTKKIRRSHRFWKWLCGVSCFNGSWISCCNCSPHLEKPQSTICSCSNLFEICRMPKCNCSFCRWNCCMPKCPSCLTCSSTTYRCYPKCPQVNMCSKC